MTTPCPIKSDKFLMALARRVRKAVVHITNENSYGDYDDLDSCCAIASHFFVSIAKRYGYNLSLIEGIAFEDHMPDDTYDKNDKYQSINHCWVQYQGKIIDLTATQFANVAKIHIVKDTNKKYYAVRKNQSVINSFKNDWPKCQTLYDENIRAGYKVARKKIVVSMKIAA